MPGKDWKLLFSTSNADFYEIAEDMMVILPRPNSRDTAETARESIELQDQHWRKVGRRGAVAVFMDNIIEQEPEARALYASQGAQALTTCYALVGETFYGHAVSAVFTGLAKPAIPTNVFRSLDEAQPWMEQMNRERGGRV